jgi:HNH endonuclease
MIGTDFLESVKVDARKRAAFKCCFCRDRMGDEVHHLVPKEQGGQGVLDNAILLCAQCHNDYGNNPLKQKQLRQARDDWYEIVERRYSQTEIEQIEQLATKDDVDQIAIELRRLTGIVDPPIDADPPELDWHQLEDRFRRIPGEAQAIWEHYESGAVEWSVYARTGDEKRIVDRFVSEARIAGRKAASLNVPRKFPGVPFPDDADNWLNVVAALVHPGTDITGSGYDAKRGRSESGAIEKLVDASQVACARLASEAQPAKSVPIADAERRQLIQQWREMVNTIHKQTRMKKNESRSVTSLLEVNADFLRLKPYLSQRSRDAIYNRTFIVAPDQSEMSGTLHAILHDIEDLEKSWGLRS